MSVKLDKYIEPKHVKIPKPFFILLFLPQSAR